MFSSKVGLDLVIISMKVGLDLIAFSTKVGLDLNNNYLSGTVRRPYLLQIPQVRRVGL